MQSHHLSWSSKPVSPLKPVFIPKTGPKNVRFTVRAWAKTEQSMYDLLSVSENADPAQIKAAFKKLARKWHPDTCRSENKDLSTQQFIQAREAYRVLSDPLLRKDYDYRLHKNNGLEEGVSLEKSGVRKEGFGDWEAQLEGLKRRSYTRATSSSWGSLMRATRSF
ncbi:chaperone protein dnaJ 20, chloroplastic-like [Tasmannia lanceolata]|uniref:chaperone protein dnaJ 20, chloroplastic-like n=1 Tax=Tasmannia lanceolata TaxID=3420 RepID=UPI004063BB80